MSNLESLLLQFNNIKSQINQIATCNCVQLDQLVKNGLNSCDQYFTLSNIEKVINNIPFCPCALCQSYQSLNTQYQSLRTQIYNQINQDYGLTPETTPFKYN